MKKEPQPLNPYNIDKFSRIPWWVKVFGAKFIIAGAVYFYFAFGLPRELDFYDSVFFIGLALGAFTDFFTSRLIKWVETPEVKTRKYRSINLDGFIALPFNLIYGIAIMAVIGFTYMLLKADTEPFFFAILYCIYDYIWLQIRWTIEFLWKDFRRKKP